MTIKQAQQELARPLVFGDELQIKALEVIANRPDIDTLDQVSELLESFIYKHEDIVTTDEAANLLDELKDILGNHLTH